jgi:hypothetical protein
MMNAELTLREEGEENHQTRRRERAARGPLQASYHRKSKNETRTIKQPEAAWHHLHLDVGLDVVAEQYPVCVAV